MRFVRLRNYLMFLCFLPFARSPRIDGAFCKSRINRIDFLLAEDIRRGVIDTGKVEYFK